MRVDVPPLRGRMAAGLLVIAFTCAGCAAGVRSAGLAPMPQLHDPVAAGAELAPSTHATPERAAALADRQWADEPERHKDTGDGPGWRALEIAGGVLALAAAVVVLIALEGALH